METGKLRAIYLASHVGTDFKIVVTHLELLILSMILGNGECM